MLMKNKKDINTRSIFNAINNQRKTKVQQQSNVVRSVFSVDEFCEWAGIGRTKAYAEMKAGKLPAKKVGRRTIILKPDAEQWRNSLPPVWEF